MVSRRGPRWVFWPAKFLWAPLVAAGTWMTFVTGFTADVIGDGQFRVSLRFFEPAGWSASPLLHGLGVVLLLAGLVFLRLYAWVPDPDRRAVVEEFPLWTLSAWAFLALALGAAWRLTGHVWDVDADGLEWRFLVALRTHWADRAVAVAALLASIACTLLSYGRSAYARYWAPRTTVGRDAR